MRSSFCGTLSVRVVFNVKSGEMLIWSTVRKPFSSAVISACSYLDLVLIAVFLFSGPGCWRSRVHCPCFDCQENCLNPAAGGCLPSTTWEVLVQNPNNQMPLLPCGQRLSLSLPSCCFFHTWQITHIVISFLLNSGKLWRCNFISNRNIWYSRTFQWHV